MIHFMSIANKSFWGIGDDPNSEQVRYPNGVVFFLRIIANGGFSIKCSYVNVDGGHGGWVGRVI